MMMLKKRPPSEKSRSSAGFTLIELMVVVTIIAILAGIGIPRMTTFIRAARASEATKELARIAEQITKVVSVNPTTTLFATYNKLPGTIGTDSLTSPFNGYKLPDDARFQYELKYFGLDNYCIQAQGTESGDAYDIYYSSTRYTDKVTWDEHISTINYVSTTEETINPGEGGCKGLTNGNFAGTTGS